MSTSLQKFTAQTAAVAPAPLTIDDAMRVGELMVMFDADGNKGNAIAKVIAGQELGIGPMASIRGFHMIKGKPSLSGELVATLIKRSGRYDFRSKVEATQATVTIYDRGEALDPVTFTLDDAKTAGLLGNENYKKYGPDMCFNRCIVRAARRHCPEVIGGAVYLESDGAELAAPIPSVVADPQTGEVIDSTATDTPSAEDIGRGRFAELRASGLSDEEIVAALREHDIESSAALADEVTWEDAQAIVADAAKANPPQSETLPGMGATTGEEPHS